MAKIKMIKIIMEKLKVITQTIIITLLEEYSA
jgi:hypothetical protein